MALAAPSDAAANVISRQAGWFLSRNATTSPRLTPNAVSAPASRRTRSFHCAHVQVRSRYVIASSSGLVSAQWARRSSRKRGSARSDMIRACHACRGVSPESRKLSARQERGPHFEIGDLLRRHRARIGRQHHHVGVLADLERVAAGGRRVASAVVLPRRRPGSCRRRRRLDVTGHRPARREVRADDRGQLLAGVVSASARARRHADDAARPRLSDRRTP